VSLARKIIAAVIVVAMCDTVVAETTVILAGKLLSDARQTPQQEVSILVKNGMIVSIEQGFVDESDYPSAQLIDHRNRFVMPGLFDMHVHLQGELGPDNKVQALTESSELVGMKSVMFAERTLQAGFTTVRDLGSDPQAMFALRDAIAKGWIKGPRIISAGQVSITGGHLDVDGMRHDLLEKYSAPFTCDFAAECQKATRQAIKYGADLIKIASTGGVLSDTSTGTGQQMTDPEIKAVVDTAHALGRKVASHAHAAEGINAALRAGVDSIEHGSYSNGESIRLFKESGAYLVPTLLAGHTVVGMAKSSDFMSPDIKAKALRVGQDMKDGFVKAYKGGVKIAYGTDSGVSKHGTNADEALLMKQAGMTEKDILISATVHAADLAGLSATVGKLEKGYVADIIALEDNPLENIEALKSVAWVMKEGVVVKQPK